MTRKSRNGAQDRANEPARLTSDGKNPPMAIQSTPYKNGAATTYTPEEITKKFKMWWSVFTTIITAFLGLLGGLAAAGWLDIPAKQRDLVELRMTVTAIAKDVSSLKDDMAAVKTSVSEIKKASASPAPEHKSVSHPKIASASVPPASPKSTFPFGK
jgi:hypothetical protein